MLIFVTFDYVCGDVLHLDLGLFVVVVTCGYFDINYYFPLIHTL
jgi:hypothetical protein